MGAPRQLLRHRPKRASGRLERARQQLRQVRLEMERRKMEPVEVELQGGPNIHPGHYRRDFGSAGSDHRHTRSALGLAAGVRTCRDGGSTRVMAKHKKLRPCTRQLTPYA